MRMLSYKSIVGSRVNRYVILLNGCNCVKGMLNGFPHLEKEDNLYYCMFSFQNDDILQKRVLFVLKKWFFQFIFIVQN